MFQKPRPNPEQPFFTQKSVETPSLSTLVLAATLAMNTACGNVLVESKGDTDGGGTSEGTTTTATVGGGGQGGETGGGGGVGGQGGETGGGGEGGNCMPIEPGKEPAELVIEPPAFQVPGGGFGVQTEKVLRILATNSQADNSVVFKNKDADPNYTSGDGYIAVQLNTGGDGANVNDCALYNEDDGKYLDQVTVPGGYLPETSVVYFDPSGAACGTFIIPPAGKKNLLVICSLNLQPAQIFSAAVWSEIDANFPAIGNAPGSVEKFSVGYWNGLQFVQSSNTVSIPVLGPVFTNSF